MRREPLWVALGSLAFGVAFSYPVLSHISHVGWVADWDLLLTLQWVPYLSVQRFHQLPLWNAYMCGGMPLLADPSVRFPAPFFLLHLLFGPTIGLHLEIPLHLAIGFGGGYLLGRVEGLNVSGRIACASLFPASSWFYVHLAVGHTIYMAYIYLPLLACFLLLAIRTYSLFWAAMGGGVIALMFCEGSPYAPTHAMLLAAILCALHAAGQRSRRPLVVFAAAAIFAAGFAAVKLLPAYRLMTIYPRGTNLVSLDYSLRTLLVPLFSRHESYGTLYPNIWPIYESGAYFSPFAVALAVLGLACSPRSVMPWMVAAVIFVALALGDGDFPYLWQLLHKFPPFSSERLTPVS